MMLLISCFGTSYRYPVSFDRTDTVALEAFLADKDVFLSDKQVKLFAETGEGVVFSNENGKWMPKIIIRDNTEEVRIEKLRAMVVDFKRNWPVYRLTSNPNLFIHQAQRLQRIGAKLGVDVNF